MANVLADMVVLLHLAFIVFVIFGGLLALKWRGVVWLHLPSVVWAALVELFGWFCPLTPLEVRLRLAAGTAGYENGFVEEYIIPLIYPIALTRNIQIFLGVSVIIINCLIYYTICRVRRRRI